MELKFGNLTVEIVRYEALTKQFTKFIPFHTLDARRAVALGVQSVIVREPPQV
ncbi:hypothetical protein [uncultured Jannaschia sp.]|uniref:hypothetical protein n=1 Tax=uncultured Jannaschia sp. TaxID=293347 RepID=UPI00260C2615|nr:hypothetical protein [uncultured Jannaschia sp.]